MTAHSGDDPKTQGTDTPRSAGDLRGDDLSPEHLIRLRAAAANNPGGVRGATPTEAVLFNDYDAEEDALAVLYENGTEAPKITVTESDAGVYTVLADGVPVAVVASADTAVTVADVMVVERNADGSAPLP